MTTQISVIESLSVRAATPAAAAAHAVAPLLDRHAMSQMWVKLAQAATEHLPPIDKFLEREFKANKKFGKRDRMQIREAFFYVFRHLEQLLELCPQEELTHERTDSVEHSKNMVRSNDQESASDLTQLILKALSTEWQSLAAASVRFEDLKTHNAEIAKNASVPKFFSKFIEERAKISDWNAHNVEHFYALQARPAPLWLRVNDDKHTLEKVLKQLETENVEVLENRGTTLRVEAKASLYLTQAFTSGMFEIQDLASQKIGLAVNAQPGEKIWDVCAGAGGKSIQLGVAMRGEGALFCTDIRAHILDEIKKRAKRNGLNNIRTMAWDGETIPDLPRIVSRQQGYDAVLVDAPCSSSGTWRRNPESRYRMNVSIIESFHQLQKSILCKVARTVKPGGRLVYATCSWLKAENEDSVEAFLNSAAGQNFTLESQSILGAPSEDSDTMFVAVLRKPMKPL